MLAGQILETSPLYGGGNWGSERWEVWPARSTGGTRDPLCCWAEECTHPSSRWRPGLCAGPECLPVFLCLCFPRTRWAELSCIPGGHLTLGCVWCPGGGGGQSRLQAELWFNNQTLRALMEGPAQAGQPSPLIVHWLPPAVLPASPGWLGKGKGEGLGRASCSSRGFQDFYHTGQHNYSHSSEGGSKQG